MSIGPAGGIAAIVGTSVAGVPPEHLLTALAALTLMTAGFLFLGRLLRVSFLQRLFPTPVFVGYIAGTGITILVGQGREIVTGGWPVPVVGLLLLKRFAPRSPGRSWSCSSPPSPAPSSASVIAASRSSAARSVISAASPCRPGSPGRCCAA